MNKSNTVEDIIRRGADLVMARKRFPGICPCQDSSNPSLFVSQSVTRDNANELVQLCWNGAEAVVRLGVRVGSIHVLEDSSRQLDLGHALSRLMSSEALRPSVVAALAQDTWDNFMLNASTDALGAFETVTAELETALRNTASRLRDAERREEKLRVDLNAALAREGKNAEEAESLRADPSAPRGPGATVSAEPADGISELEQALHDTSARLCDAERREEQCREELAAARKRETDACAKLAIVSARLAKTEKELEETRKELMLTDACIPGPTLS